MRIDRRVLTRIVCALAVTATLYGAVELPSAIAQDPAAQPTAPRFDGYRNAPEFKVLSRKDKMFFYPCDQCHASMEPNDAIRELNVMHVGDLEHGSGRIWCLSCHDLENRNFLKTLLDEPLDFDDANLVCSGCHASRHEDWVFGAHGKRLNNWQGERIQYDCADCHDPHKPAIPVRAPMAAPRVRAGLEHAAHVQDPEQVSSEPTEADDR